MIDISHYIERLNWLKEFMAMQIENNKTMYGYGYNEYRFIKGFHRSLSMSNFNDFCVYKKYKTINTTN